MPNQSHCGVIFKCVFCGRVRCELCGPELCQQFPVAHGGEGGGAVNRLASTRLVIEHCLAESVGVHRSVAIAVYLPRSVGKSPVNMKL